MSDVMTLGTKLADLCKQGKNLDAIDALYASDIVSVEAMEGGPMDRTLKGLDAVRGKNQWWMENHDIHGGDVKGPFPHQPDRFALIYMFDVTPKAGPMKGQRMQMEEVGLFTVKNGKIVREEFFYSMG